MLEEILQTIVQSLISVFILFALTRIMGKKQVSQLTFFDYVVGISIGSIAAAFAVDPSINYAKGITALVIYAIFPIALSFIALKSYRARKILDGTPTVLIQNGKIIQANLKKTKLNVNDLLEECRIKNAFDIADVEFAILETNGKVSVLMKSENQPVTPKDMGIQTPYKGLCLIVVMDGKILEEHLAIIGKDKKWLIGELQKQNASDYKNLLLAYLDTNSQLHIQRKNKGAAPDMLM